MVEMTNTLTVSGKISTLQQTAFRPLVNAGIP